MIRAILIHKHSPFLGQECALCKHPFAPDDEIVVCPMDGSRHHAHCWRANNNGCSAYGCTGTGEVIGTSHRPLTELDDPQPETADESADEAAQEEAPPERPSRLSKLRILPTQSIGCAQGCLLLSIAAAILLVSIGCFGLWAIADYIMLEILGWGYRAPLEGMILLTGIL